MQTVREGIRQCLVATHYARPYEIATSKGLAIEFGDMAFLATLPIAVESIAVARTGGWLQIHLARRNRMKRMPQIVAMTPSTMG